KKSVSGQTAKSQFRLPRYGNKQLGNISKMVTFKNNAGTYNSYEMVNFSKYGLAFMMKEDEIEESEALRVGEVLEDLQVIIGYKKVYEGRASVIDLREQGKTLVVGLKLEESMLEVDKILYMGKSEDIKNDLKEFLHMLPIGDKVSGEFKQIVADMRYYLEAVETRLNKEEERLTNLDLRLKHKIEKDILHAVIKPFTKTMNPWFLKLSDLAKNFKKEEHEIHKRYFQNQLHYSLLQSPFIKRLVEKPFGYSGDYIMISMIYDGAYDGDTLLGKLISKYTYNLDAGRIVRLRKEYIKKIIFEKLKNTDFIDKRIKILSVGCGPAREIEEIAKFDSNIPQCEISLLDFDERPLYCVEDRLSRQKIGENTKINFVNKSIRSIVKERKKHRYDLIYSLGLMDYLSDNTCKVVLKSLFDALNPGGTLVVSQFGFGNATKLYMEFVGDWYLIYRFQDDMMKWLHVIDKPYEYKFHQILNNACNLLIIEKQKKLY
ncbi:MAG: class I SAM-dependent methyltransferase, partial [Candidatus Aureabacteria bacterium]|nr:class I SAM-dependent methyltransferase [Candidatus Auribacterota bacterium]